VNALGSVMDDNEKDETFDDFAASRFGCDTSLGEIVDPRKVKSRISQSRIALSFYSECFSPTFEFLLCSLLLLPSTSAV